MIEKIKTYAGKTGTAPKIIFDILHPHSDLCRTPAHVNYLFCFYLFTATSEQSKMEESLIKKGPSQAPSRYLPWEYASRQGCSQKPYQKNGTIRQARFDCLIQPSFCTKSSAPYRGNGSSGTSRRPRRTSARRFHSMNRMPPFRR